MLYILDTDVVSNLRKQHPNPKLLAWLAQVPQEETGLPLVVVFKIQLGIEGLRLEGKAGKASEIEAWLEGLLETRGHRIMAPGADVVRLQARMFATPALRNFLRPQPRSTKLKFGADLIVAATAIVHGGIVVTFNVFDYQRIHCHFPLPGLYHPGRGEWIISPKE